MLGGRAVCEPNLRTIGRRALLRGAVRSNVVVKPNAQIDERTFELRGKGLEWAGGANRGSRRRVEWLLPGSSIQAEALRGKTAVTINAKRNRHNSFVAQIKRFRHHRDPVLFQLREQPVNVTLKIHTLSRSENRDAVARLRAASPAAAVAATASPTTGNGTLRSVRAAARRVLDRIL